MMKFCTACGHELGVGRFCTNCGTPVATDPADSFDDDFRTGTAERIAIASNEPWVAPPPPEAPPEPPSDYRGRFPLFADDAAHGTANHEPTAVRQPFGHTHLAAPRQAEEWPAAPPPPSVPPPPEPAPYAFSWEEPQPQRARLRISPIVAVLLAMVLVVALFGAWMLFFDSTDDSTAQTPNTGEHPSGSKSASTGSSQPPASEDVTAPANPGELANTADPKAPITSPPSKDLLGNLVSFRAANMTDGVTSTAWRMPGSGAGQVLTFRLPTDAVLTQVGLINGYAKIGRDEKGHKTDWYRLNRQITKVTWIFDDGTKVTQDLASTSSLQTIDIDPVRTTVIRLKLETVTKTPPKGRNYTPISEVSLVGG